MRPALPVVLLLALGVVACDEAPTEVSAPSAEAEPGTIENAGEPFMKVQGFQVGRREVEQVFRNKGVPEPMIESAMTSPGGFHVLEEYALATALYRAAIDEGLHEDPQVQLEIAFAERRALSRAMQRVLAKRQLTDERVEAWLEDNREQFALPQKQGREIVVGSESYAQELMDRLESGEDFAKLARDHSLDTRTASNGGYLGWFSIQDRPDLGRAIFAHATNRVLGPLESKAGWHIVEILDSRDATPPEEQKLIARSALEAKALTEASKKLREALDVEMQFAGAGGDPHLPDGHPPTDEGEGSNQAPAEAGSDASSGDEAGEE